MAAWAPVAFLLVGALASAAKGPVEQELSSDCREFLYSKTLPTGYENRDFRLICQSYKNKVRYVTLYNTAERIPVYSAYVFQSSEGEKCVDAPWMYEPQVKRKVNFLA